MTSLDYETEKNAFREYYGRGLDRALAPAKSDPEGSPLVAKIVAGIGQQGIIVSFGF